MTEQMYKVNTFYLAIAIVIAGIILFSACVWMWDEYNAMRKIDELKASQPEKIDWSYEEQLIREMNAR